MGKRQRIEELELALKQLKGELRKARRAATTNANIAADLMIERDRLSDALAQFKAALKNAQAGDAGWATIAERQRVYIKALEERLAGTWNPADTHQREYDAMYASRKARN